MGRKALQVLVVIIFSSFNSFNNNLNSSIEFKNIDSLFNLNYGGCSLTVERTVVVRKTRVRLSPSASEDKSTLSADLVHCF